MTSAQSATAVNHGMTLSPTPVPWRGQSLLNRPLLNKGTAFTVAERQALGLEGLLPPEVGTLDTQVQRIYRSINRKADPLEQYIALVSLQDRNETLFYRLLMDHVDEFLPIVYTPTVGRACQEYSQIFRRPRGLWITPNDTARLDNILRNAPHQDVRLIVVTDNERILGLGDLGAGGIGIPIGKLVLYTVAAGIHPADTLPISLDVGTDNKALLDDPLYIGWRHGRLRGEPYDDFVEQFIGAVKRCFPHALLQWEDFKKGNAFRLLDRYRKRLCSFNDDIQGTAAIGVAAIMAASRLTKLPVNRQRVLVLGAGAAGLGIARQLRDLFIREGMDSQAVSRSILMMDSVGIVHMGRPLDERGKEEFAWPVSLAQSEGLPLDHGSDLLKVVEAYRPTVLLGTSGQAGVFTEPVVRAMARHVTQPVILPFSNPNSKAEGKPEDLIAWTAGRAVVAAGSPFAPVQYGGRTIRIGQGNNVYVFPGVGLGVLVAQASMVTDAMFTVAAQALAAEVSDEDLASGSLFPPLTKLRTISARIAEAVVKQAREEGVGRPLRDSQIPAAVANAMWWPVYQPYVPGPAAGA